MVQLGGKLGLGIAGSVSELAVGQKYDYHRVLAASVSGRCHEDFLAGKLQRKVSV